MTQGRVELLRRNRRDRRFRLYGLVTITVILSILGLMLAGIAYKSTNVFWKPYIQVQYPDNSVEKIRDAIYQALTSSTDVEAFQLNRREAMALISPGAEVLVRQQLAQNPNPGDIWLLMSDDADVFIKNPSERDKPQSERRLNDRQMDYLTAQIKSGNIETKFNWLFFTNGASRAPEFAGIKSALLGSFYTILVTLLLAFPLGIAAAVYVEEFAPRNKFVQFIELNINNLASVPSIVFGLLGLMVFINIMHLPRSSSIVAGMTLALMIMPTIFITTRTALHTVPKMIARAAEALGATRVQVVFHHKIPLALPGIVTGAILGVARALGESAALLMIGMVAFVADPPLSPKDPATVLPVQIFNWSRNPEAGFQDHTAAAIMVMLVFLMALNLGAIFIRKKFQQRW